MKKYLPYLLLLALIAVFSGILLIGPLDETNAVKVNGVIFVSDEMQVQHALPLLALNETFIVSPAVYSPGKKVNLFMSNASNLFIVILTGNGKEVVQLYRVFDESNNLLHCETNYGDIMVQEQISAEQCLEMLESSESAKVLIDFPSSFVAGPVVRLSEKKAVVQSNGSDQLGSTSFTLLQAMFANADSVLAASNRLTEKLS